jgi:hypothetical protein
MQAQPNVPEPKKKRSDWDRFFNFLAMGGFILILVVGVILVLVISSLLHC